MNRSGLARAAVAAALMVFALTGTAAGAQRYASPTGTAAASSGCHEDAACDIFAALDLGFVNLGDEVLLAPGVYDVSQQVYIGAGVNIHGTGRPEQTRIVSSYGGTISVALVNTLATLSDVQVETSDSSVAALGVINGVARRVVAINSQYGACTGYTATFSDSICIGGTNPTAHGFSISANSPADDPSMTMRNVTAISRSTVGSAIDLSVSNGAVAALDAKSVIARGGAADVSANATGAGTSTVSLDHSNFATRAETIGGSVTSPSANFNQAAAPIFVDPANGNYRQGIGSPTIDAGALDGSSGATDVDGNPRVFGAAVDIGASEYNTVAPAPPLITIPAVPLPDVVAPKIKITKRPRSKTTSTKAKFRFSANEPAKFRCKLDKRRTRTCKSSYSARVKRGSHKLKITATDAAGNSSSRTVRWKVVRR